MSDVIFARPRHNYMSYQDIYRLIELSGYPLIYFDQIDASARDKTYILTIVNGENQQGWPDAQARIVLYDLEWRSPSEYPRLPGVREVWAADAWYAKLVGAKYVPLGSHIELKGNYPFDECSENHIRWDAALLAYLSPRRQAAVSHLQRNGITLAPNGWGRTRWETLNATWCMLHVHQHDGIPAVAPSRFALAASFHMPLVTETLADAGIFRELPLLEADFANLPQAVKQCTESDYWDSSTGLYELLCERYTFRKCIERAL